MGMSGRFNGISPPGFKEAFWANSGGEINRDTGERIDGICKSCEQWDAELVEGFCRDEDCKDKRHLLAISEGRAIKVIEGLPGGVRIFHTKDGKQNVK